MAGKKMKGGEIILRVTQNGLEVVDKKADKASKSLKRTGQSAHSADRALKGAAQASSGASKNFSKMSQGITGGLVPAYATLAANLFAVDALFRFLKSSADFRVLTEGQMAFAAATGVAYRSLAKDLQSATRNMINFRDAAQAGAIGRAAGLSANQLTELSEAAFTVSMALGRDVTDSFNRLVRGVTKAEPELLDELGIVLRLEEATTKYAASLGLNKNQLSIYQKSQAVVNEVLDQAERKFGKINEIMEPSANSIAQLGVAAEGAIDALRPIISALAEPVADFFKNNVNATITALGLFATSILRSVIPSIGDLRIKQAEQAEAHIADLERMQKEYDELLLKKKKLGGTPIAQDRAKKSLGKKRLGQIGGESARKLERGEALSNREVGAIKAQITKNQASLGVSDKLKNKIFKDLDQIKGKSSATTQKMKLDFKTFGTSTRMQFNKLKQAALPVFASLERGFQRVTMALSGLMTAVAYIGMAVLAFQLLKSAYNKFFGPDQSQVDQFNERLNESLESTKGLNLELTKMAEVRSRGLIGGVADTAVHTAEALQSANLTKIIADFNLLHNNMSVNEQGFREFAAEAAFTFDRLGELDERFKQFSATLLRGEKLTEDQIEDLKEFKLQINNVGAAFKQLKEVEGELIKENNRLVQSLPKIPFQNMLMLLKQQKDAYEDIVAGDNGIKAYQADLDLVTARLEYFNRVQQITMTLQTRANRLTGASKFGFLAGTSSADIKLLQEENKLTQQKLKLNEAIDQFNESGLSHNDKMAEGLLLQIKSQRELVKLQKDSVEAAKIQANEIFMTYNALYAGIQKDLGAAIGKALRGDSSGFEDIGKNLADNLAKAIGDALSKQFLEDIMPKSLQPKSVQEKIVEGGNYHAQEVQLAIEKGGFYHATAIQGVTKESAQTLNQITNKILAAEKGVNLRKIEELDKESARIAGLRDVAKSSSSPAAILERSQQPGFETEARTFMDAQGFTVAQLAEIQKLKQEIDGLKTGKLNMPYAVPGGSKGLTQEALDVMQSSANEVRVNELNRQIDKYYEDSTDTFIQYLEDNTLKAQEDYDAFVKRLQQISTESKSLEDANKVIDEQINAKVGGGDSGVKKGALHTKVDLTKEKIDTEGNKKREDLEKQVENADKFSKNLNQFSGVIGMFGAVAGESERTGKIMAAAAKIQMAVAVYQQVLQARQAAKEGANFFASLFGFGGRQGGIMSRHGRSYSQGGVADGPTAGYPAVLHGREAVVPLPNGRSIPVDIGKQQMGNNNVSININMEEGTSDTKSDAEDAKALGQAINTAVLQVLEREQRQGGLLGN